MEVFNRLQARGVPRVVDGPSPPAAQARNSPVASPAIPTNSPPPTPPRTPARSNTSTPRMSPRIPTAPPSQSHSRHGSVHSATPTRARSRSPPVFYDNVSYSRGASTTPRSSPRDVRRAIGTPRVVVETPIDLPSYPSDTESNTSASSYQEDFSPRYSSSNRGQDSPHHRTPASPLRSKERQERRTPRAGNRVMVETPPGLKIYLADDEEAFNYYVHAHKAVQATSPLSPIGFPRLRTPEDVPAATPESRSSRHSSSSSPRPGSSKRSPKLPPGIPQINIYVMCSEAHHSRHRQREEHHTQHASSASEFGLSISTHGPSVLQGVPEIDPRSPLSRSGSAQSVLCPFALRNKLNEITISFI